MGFNEEKIIVLPKGIRKELEENDLTSSLFVTDIGFFDLMVIKLSLTREYQYKDKTNPLASQS